MTAPRANPLFQAVEVAGRSLRRDLSGRGDHLVHTVTRRPWARSAAVGWRVENLDLHGRTFRYRVTDNDGAYGPHGPGSPPLWAINIHGYFAGGSMYARESATMAARLGWRVVNPSLPGFGGSTALEDGPVTIAALSDHLDIVRQELDIDSFVLIGHSMGGAIAIDSAAHHPNNVLGIIYRDGVATPDWQDRHGLPARLLGRALPGAAPMIDLMSAVTLDAPDLLIGHLFRTIRALAPDLQSNLKTIVRSAPVAKMMRGLDLTESVRQVAALGIPIYAAWGCFDRIVNAPAAASFARAAGVEIQWVPGGHSWMLARPSGQSDLLTENRSGVNFLTQVIERYDHFTPPALRATEVE